LFIIDFDSDANGKIVWLSNQSYPAATVDITMLHNEIEDIDDTFDERDVMCCDGGFIYEEYQTRDAIPLLIPHRKSPGVDLTDDEIRENTFFLY